MSDDFDPDELYEETDRDTLARWIEAVEENIEIGPARGGTRYTDREMKFVTSIRTRLDADTEEEKPLSGKQLVWLRTLYERS